MTCGDVGLERAVVLPKSLFRLVLSKLDENTDTTRYKSPTLARWYSKDRVDNFLSFRCGKEFLCLYLDRHPDLLKRISSPGLFLSSVSEVDLAIRLHKLGMLPEENRTTFVNTVVSYAIEGGDLYAVDSMRIQSIFTETELADFRNRIRTELIPNLAEVRRTWQSNRDSGQRPDEYLDPLIESFGSLKAECADDPSLVVLVDQQIELAREWIAEKLEDEPAEEDRPPRSFGDVEAASEPPATARSIFDDVDE